MISDRITVVSEEVKLNFEDLLLAQRGMQYLQLPKLIVVFHQSQSRESYSG